MTKPGVMGRPASTYRGCFVSVHGPCGYKSRRDRNRVRIYSLELPHHYSFLDSAEQSTSRDVCLPDYVCSARNPTRSRDHCVRCTLHHIYLASSPISIYAHVEPMHNKDASLGLLPLRHAYSEGRMERDDDGTAVDWGTRGRWDYRCIGRE